MNCCETIWRLSDAQNRVVAHHECAAGTIRALGDGVGVGTRAEEDSMTCLCGDSECSSGGEAQGTKTRTKPKRTPVEAPKAFVLTGDCLEVMPSLPANSVDAVVTDPPYGLTNGGLGGFMGKEWDSCVPGPHFWTEALRVAKPGAYLVAFGGTRTYHRLTCAIEDAGWEIRDCLMWLYGTGFPKSLDVSKAIDASLGMVRAVGPVDPARAGRLVNQRGEYATDAGWSAGSRKVTVDPPATADAQRWEGWGTALKPAWEPIILARKSLEGTVAANVLKYGTGGLNIDGCRIPTSALDAKAMERANTPGSGRMKAGGSPIGTFVRSSATGALDPQKGRWPANVILDEEAGRLLDAQTGKFGRSGIAVQRNGGGQKIGDGRTYAGSKGLVREDVGYGDVGGVSRFFYCSKASKSERERGCQDLFAKQQDLSREEDAPGANNPRNRGGKERSNHHPTVKPISLMRWLVRLVTPPGGFVLDPFCGSGSTGVACLEEGMRFAGIEQDPEYAEITKSRLAAAKPCPSEDSAGTQDEDSDTSAP